MWPPNLIGWWLMIKAIKYKITCLFDYVVTAGHVKNGKHISTSMGPMTTKLDRIMAYEKGSPLTVATWRIKNFIPLSPRTLWLPNMTRWWFMIRGPFNRDTWFCDHVIICSYVIYKRRYFSNSKALLTPNLIGSWLMTWNHDAKNHITPKKFLPFIFFSTPVMHI